MISRLVAPRNKGADAISSAVNTVNSHSAISISAKRLAYFSMHKVFHSAILLTFEALLQWVSSPVWWTGAEGTVLHCVTLCINATGVSHYAGIQTLLLIAGLVIVTVRVSTTLWLRLWYWGKKLDSYGEKKIVSWKTGGNVFLHTVLEFKGIPAFNTLTLCPLKLS